MNARRPKIEVRRSPVHGNGVFAAEKIPAGTLVCEYSGELISAEEAERRAEARSREDPRAPIYVFEIDENLCIDATDTAAEDNPARFINHSCEENCEAVWNARERRLEIRALRDVESGEELSFDYGFGLVGFFEHPCRCGKKSCPGYIVARPLRPALLRRLAAKRRGNARSLLRPAKSD